MNDRILVDEWHAMRRGSLRLFPVAATLALVFGVLVYVEGLHRSEAGFLVGLLFGAIVYWAILEVVTVVRIDRLLRKAERTQTSEARLRPTSGGGAISQPRTEN